MASQTEQQLVEQARTAILHRIITSASRADRSAGSAGFAGFAGPGGSATDSSFLNGDLGILELAEAYVVLANNQLSGRVNAPKS